MSINPNVKGTFPMDETKFRVRAGLMESTNQIEGSYYELFPGYASLIHAHNAAWGFIGKHWADFRTMFVEFFHQVFTQASTRKFIKQIMMDRAGKYIPVRTGHLYDALFRSIFFTHKSWGNSRHLMTCWFRWPLDRPFPIPGLTAHLPPAKGHGDTTGVINMPIKYQAPNIQFLGVGPRGGLIYGLNDPQAVNDPTVHIIEEALLQMRDMFRDAYKGLIIKLYNKKRGLTGAVTVKGGIGPGTPYTPRRN